jgi:transposase
MLIIPSGFKIHLALRYTDKRKGLDGLAVLVQESLKQDPFSGHLFAFRGKKASIMKVLFWDGNGLCLFTKKLNEGGSVWPRLTDPGGTVQLSPVQLALLIEGNDWHAPQKIWRPATAV